MRRYLKEFLSDRRVIEVPRLKWWPILNLVILTVRPSRKGKDYDKIWNRDRDESPLKTITRAQSEKLAVALGASAIVVDWAMRYGNPATAAAIDPTTDAGLRAAFAGAALSPVCGRDHGQRLRSGLPCADALRWQPAVRVVPPYYAEPALHRRPGAIPAPGDGTARTRTRGRSDLLSTACRNANVDLGDPYYQHCQADLTVAARRGSPGRRPLGTRPSNHASVASNGSNPATIEAIERLAKGGVRRLIVIAPGFAADCLETLEELDMEKPRRLPGKRRGELCLRSLSQRRCGGDVHDRSDRAARIERLDLIGASVVVAVCLLKSP